jgi:hypothetical protein
VCTDLDHLRRREFHRLSGGAAAGDGHYEGRHQSQ